jgi:WD40 repeat protein
VLTGHQGAVNSVAVHPSGKLALSVGRDNTLRLWNLVQGRCSFTRRLRGSAEKVLWHKSGLYYLIVIGTEVQVFRAADNECVVSLKHKSRVNQALFCETSPVSANDSSSASSSSENEAQSSPESGRIGCLCDDKMLLLYDFAGKNVGQLSLSDLGGRPRDMWNSPLSLDSLTASSEDPDKVKPLLDVLSSEGDCLAIATSLGRIALVSCRAVEEGYTLEESTLISTDTRSEPRITGIVAWTQPAPSTTSNSTKQKQRESVQKPATKPDLKGKTKTAVIVENRDIEKAADKKKKRKVTLEEPSKPTGKAVQKSNKKSKK